MSRFLDGPVAGLVLHHSRAPVYLRVVLSAEGEPDVLDQLDDEPRADEVIYAYQQVAGTMVGPIHVCYRDGSGRSGWSASADYSHVDVDAEVDLGDTAAWRAWVDRRARDQEEIDAQD